MRTYKAGVASPTTIVKLRWAGLKAAPRGALVPLHEVRDASTFARARMTTHCIGVASHWRTVEQAKQIAQACQVMTARLHHRVLLPVGMCMSLRDRKHPNGNATQKSVTTTTTTIM